MEESLKILRWDVTGWAGIDHVSVVNPSPHLIEFFSADNAEGKSSLLESLRGAIGGATAIGEGVIRAGASRAEVDLDLGPVTVRCTVSQKGRNLTVKTSDGKPVPAAQTYLDGKVGRLLDPSSFRDWSEKDQADVLRDLAGAEWLAKRSELEAAERIAYDARKDAKRAVDAMGALVPVPPAEPVDVAALAEELRTADAENRRQAESLAAWEREAERAHAAWERQEQAARAEWDREQSARAQAIDRAEEAVARQSAELERLLRQVEQAQAALTALGTARRELPEPERDAPAPSPAPDPGQRPVVAELDTTELRQQLAAASEQNKAAALYARHMERVEERKLLVEAAQAAEAAVESTRAALAEHDKAATLPEGLAIASDGLTYQGRPLGRMSTGECYALAFRVAVALGQQILVLDNAEAMGPRAVEQVQSLAVEHGVQVVLATRGQPHTPGAYELRNGRLVLADQ